LPRIGRRDSRRQFRWRRLVDRVDLEPDVTDVPQAMFRILGEAATQEVSNRRGRRRRQRRPVGLTLEDLRDRVRDGVAGKGSTAGQHLVEYAPEGPDVAALVDAVTARLFGTH